MQNIVVLGKGTLAIRIVRYLKDKNNVIVVPVIPEPDWTDSLKSYCVNHIIPYCGSGNYKDIKNIINYKDIDLVISVFYDKILDKDFLSECKRAINIHNSPLPKYRGMNPINWALNNGETEHGVTIHELSERIDEGNIISRVKYPIYPEFDEVEDVYERSIDYAWLLFKETIINLHRIKSVPQDNSIATYYSKKDYDNLGDRKSWRRDE